jgi:hypothetical protein
MLLLLILCTYIAGFYGKNILDIPSSLTFETKVPGHSNVETIKTPVTESIYKQEPIIAMGTEKKNYAKSISPEKAKNWSFADCGVDNNDNNFLIKVITPSNSWTSSERNSTFLENPNNKTSNIKSINVATYNQVSPQSSRTNTYKYNTRQPISPSLKDYSSNDENPGESSHFVGADGHIITLVNNESAVDPSYKQLVEFIKKDNTNEIPYNNTSFVCSDAAERVQHNAETNGFRCAWVYIEFTNEQVTLNPSTHALVVGHACNLFNTTDKGLVAIDCTRSSYSNDTGGNTDLSICDNEVSLAKNGDYTPRLLYSFFGSDKLEPFMSMGKIADYYVYW